MSGHVDDERRRPGVVDEVVADPLRLPRLAIRVISPKLRVEHGVAKQGRGSLVIGMPILPIRDGDRSGTHAANQLDHPPHVVRRRANRAIGQCEILSPRGAQHFAAPPRLPSRALPAIRCSTSRRASGHTGRRHGRAHACLASVPPRPISRSSGWGPNASRSTWELIRESGVNENGSSPLSGAP